MAYSAPLPLDATHDVVAFDCGHPALNDWLARHALQAQTSGSARSYVVLDSGRIAGYFSLAVAQVDSLAAPERVRKGMGAFPVPALLLARLAVALQDQGQGLAIGMLQEAIRKPLLIAEHAGVRALLTHPIDAQATQFYLRFGFEVSPIRDQQLLLLLKDARKLLQTVPQGSTAKTRATSRPPTNSPKPPKPPKPSKPSHQR